jgi:hypothetical protein
MRHAWIRRVGIITLVGSMILSSGLVLMTNSAQAAAIVSNSNTSSTTSWDKNLPSASRFTVLSDFGGAAVRDNNTGLVWEQAPNATANNWFQSAVSCVNRNVGGSRGWRLPSMAELASLMDPSLVAPFVPASVFTGVQLDFYWTATTVAIDTVSGGKWGVRFANTGDVGGLNRDGSFYAWCVRGPMNADAY